jgi:hypothetical protein
MRTRVLVMSLAASLLVAAPLVAQAPEALLSRWVGTHEGRPLHFDFYGDTMVVVNDLHPLHFEVRDDSLRVWGDTAFDVVFWFAMDRLLVETVDGRLITMAPQDRMARPLEGRWRGSPMASDMRLELAMYRGGTAQWRALSGGRSSVGEWNRASRVITFAWDADSTEWVARYDASGGALLFDSTFSGSGMTILRRVFR